MKPTTSTLKLNSVARVDIGALLAKSTKTNPTIKRNLSSALRVVGQLRKSLDTLSTKLKELESRKKLNNFEIQDLMSAYNQAERLASTVSKKRDDTASAVIGKI
jgi:hypothetical protein